MMVMKREVVKPGCDEEWCSIKIFLQFPYIVNIVVGQFANVANVGLHRGMAVHGHSDISAFNLPVFWLDGLPHPVQPSEDVAGQH